MKFPFEKCKRITQKEAVEFIRSIEYPDEDCKIAGNKIRDRINTARKNGLLKTMANDPISYPTNEFFYWARTKWPTLAKVEGIPVRVIYGGGAATAASATVSGTGYLIPQDREMLAQAYRDVQDENVQLKIIISSLQQRNKTLEEENKELCKWRDNELERRKKCGRRANYGTD